MYYFGVTRCMPNMSCAIIFIEGNEGDEGNNFIEGEFGPSNHSG
jgi:hypothetical protein